MVVAAVLAVAAPEVPEVAAPEVAAVPEVVVEDVVDAVYEDEASASNITASTGDLLPPPPAFAVPPMEWLLGGLSAGWLVDDPERDFSDEERAAPSSSMYYYLRHGFGPCLPSPTPSDEDVAHFSPPGYGPVPELSSLPVVVPKPEKTEATAPARVIPDLNLPVPEMEEEEEEEAEDAVPANALPTPSPEARVLLRRFAAAMAARPAGFRAGTWSPVKLGLTDREGGFRLDEPSTATSR
jgi:hypothetical protein